MVFVPQFRTGRVFIGIVLVALVLFGLYWLFGGSFGTSGERGVATAPVDSNEPIKIGAILPLTGDAAVYGEPGQRIIQLAVEEVNAAGGVNGRPLRVTYEDGKCNGRDASSAMQKLVNVDKVQIGLGGFCSSESLAAEPIATQNKVALFSPGSSSPDLTGKSFYFFRNYPSDATQGSVLAEVAYTKKSWRRVAFLQEQLDYPLGVYKAFSQKFAELGGQIIKEEFPTSGNDFRSQLTKLRSQNPDALFVDTQTPAAGERVFRQLKDLNWKPAILLSDAIIGDRQTVMANKDILEGALGAEFGMDENNPKFAHLKRAYVEKYGGNSVPYASYGQTEYDAVYMLRDALLAVGNNGEKVAEWFRTVKDWNGASGQVNIQANGDRTGGHRPEVVRSGKVELYQ